MDSFAIISKVLDFFKFVPFTKTCYPLVLHYVLNPFPFIFGSPAIFSSS